MGRAHRMDTGDSHEHTGKKRLNNSCFNDLFMVFYTTFAALLVVILVKCKLQKHLLNITTNSAPRVV